MNVPERLQRSPRIMSRPVARPTGTVTFLFTDMEESSGRWEADASATDTLVAAHDKLVRTVVEGHDGYVFTTMGDGFAVAFQRASDAVAAAVDVQESFTSEEWAASGLRVRMGLHTGEAVERDGDYFGPTVNRAARIMGLAHGGQILLSAATVILAQGLDTVELGEYQLRGLTRPERLHQVVKPGLEREFPPLRGDQGTAHNLPAALTSFVGRGAEIDDLAVRVTEGRLVSLVGPGGAGKTRLAIEAGRRLLDEFPYGVWLAELAVLRDPAQVASTVAAAMGHHDPLAEAGGPALVRHRLGAAIGDQRVLLVLDNCEHVMEAAADLVAALLRMCGQLVILATSRQSLGVAGERLVEVGSLDLPAADDAAAVAESGAGALFMERAQAVHPRFGLDPHTAAAVAEVCRRLEGLPLAIELVAARARLLTAAQIGERLEETLALPAPRQGGVERHQTMRAALVWSYDLLSEAEQVLFRRLAVFRSSFILEAAAAVAPKGSGDILSILGGLVDKSLVAVVDGPAGQRRFRLLQPVRQFAAELLEGSGEQDDAATRQRDHLLSRLRNLADYASGLAAYREMAAEVDNVRAAVQHSIRSSEPEPAVALIQAYGGWWNDLGLIDEQFGLFESALATADHARIPVGVLSSALSQASWLATHLGRLDDTRPFIDQLTSLRDQYPQSLTVRADWAFAMGHHARNRAGGDLSQATRFFRDAQEADVARGVPAAAAYAAANIVFSAVLWDSVDAPAVSRAIGDSTLLAQTGGAPNMVAFTRLLDGVVRVMGGANDVYPSCLQAFAELEGLDGGWATEWGGFFLCVAAELAGDRSGATAHTLRWVRWCRRSGERTMLTGGIRGTARLCATAGQPAESLRLWGGAERIEAVTGMRYMPLMQRLDRPLRQKCTDTLGPDVARLLAEGASWSVSEASQAAEEALLRLQHKEHRPGPRGMPVAPPPE